MELFRVIGLVNLSTKERMEPLLKLAYKYIHVYRMKERVNEVLKL